MDYVSKSSSRSLYEQYVGNSSIGNKSHFASHEDFISDLSAYDMEICSETVFRTVLLLTVYTAKC